MVSNTRAVSDPLDRFVLPSMLFCNFQKIKTYIILKVFGQQMHKFLTNVQTAGNELPITHYLLQKKFIIFSFH